MLYRVEDYDKALSVYQDIVKNAHDDYSDERETNLGAVLVYLQNKNVSSQIYFRISELLKLHCLLVK